MRLPDVSLNLEKFLKGSFLLLEPKIHNSKPAFSSTSATASLSFKETENLMNVLLKNISDLENKVHMLLQCVKEESDQKKSKYFSEVKLLTNQRKMSLELKRAMAQLGELSTRNVNKRIKRKKSKIDVLENKVESLELKQSELLNNNEHFEELNKAIETKLSNAL